MERPQVEIVYGNLYSFYCGIIHLPDDFLDGLDKVVAKEKYAFAIKYKGKRVKFTKEQFLELFEESTDDQKTQE